MRRATLILWGFAFGCVLVPGLFFYQTWYGTRLGDDALAEFLADDAQPHQSRHALEELSKRFAAGAPGMDRWTDPVLAVSRRDDDSLRIAAAWAIQEDARRPEFHARLVEMLSDPSILVRRTAATSLARGGSDEGLSVIRSMLAPHTISTPVAGTLEQVVSQGERLDAGSFVARVRISEEQTAEIRAPVPGAVRKVAGEAGSELAAGAEVVVLAPDGEHALNAVTALILVGTADDEPLLAQTADPRSGYPESVQQQARAALAAIRARTGE